MDKQNMPEEESKIEGVETEAREDVPEFKAEKKDLSTKEIIGLSKTAIEAISGEKPEKGITKKNFESKIEKSILKEVHSLPEELAKELKTVDVEKFNAKAAEIISQIEVEEEPIKIAELQEQLIYQYIVVISRVQNGGDKGFTPAIAREVKGMDCSLSAWSLKEKLQSAGIKDFQFGYLPGHAVGVVKLADGRDVYVDAQNGIVEEVKLQKVGDKEKDALAYSIFEIDDSTRKKVTGHLPGEQETTRTNPTGSNYTPKWIGIQGAGILHTVGNMHMFTNPESPTFNTETGRKFRESIGMSGSEGNRWRDYYKNMENFTDEVLAEGKQTINSDENKWGNLERARHQAWMDEQMKIQEQQEIDRLKEGLKEK